MRSQPTVLVIKWGTLFSATDVNVLYRACAANTVGDLRFVCLTDDADGLDDGIESRPIPDIGLSDADIRRPGVWRKMALYHQDLHDLDRVLFVDLDMMIVGDLTPFFAPTKGMVFLNMGKSWHPNPVTDHVEGGTAIFSYVPRDEADILAQFQADPAGHMDRFHNEQDFAVAHASGVDYWPEGTVISFKRHLCRRYFGGFVRAIKPVPAGASVIAFHGDPRPAVVRDNAIWGRFPHLHRGTHAVISDYWAKYASGTAKI